MEKITKTISLYMKKRKKGQLIGFEKVKQKQKLKSTTWDPCQCYIFQLAQFNKMITY